MQDVRRQPRFQAPTPTVRRFWRNFRRSVTSPPVSTLRHVAFCDAVLSARWAAHAACAPPGPTYRRWTHGVIRPTAVTSVWLRRRLSGCSGSTICARGNTGNTGNSDIVGSALRRIRVLDQRTEQTGKLRGHHQLGGRRRAERLERLQILEAHGLTVEVTRDRGDLSHGLRIAFSAQDGCLARALPFENRSLLLTLGDPHGGVTLAISLDDDGTAATLGGHLPGHRCLDLLRGGDLANLHRRHLDAPALGDLVELAAQGAVDVFALREHLVEQHVADHRAQGGDGDATRGIFILLDVDDARGRIDDLGVDQEVDRNRGVVLGDAGLRGDVEHALAQIGANAAIDEGNKQDQAGAPYAHEATEP